LRRKQQRDSRRRRAVAVAGTATHPQVRRAAAASSPARYLKSRTLQSIGIPDQTPVRCEMLPPTPMLLAAAPGSTATVILAPRWTPLRVPRKGRALRPARIRAAAAIGGEFGGLGRRRAVAGEFIERLRNVLPGGSWWRLEDGEEDGDGGGRAKGSGTTAVSALRRMWGIVAADRWVVYAGFVSLVGAAVMRAVMWLTAIRLLFAVC
jgi:hypothetical protein